MADCEICSSAAQTTEDLRWKGFDCPRCGRWGRSDSLVRSLLQLDWADPAGVHARSRLSHVVRRRQAQLELSRWAELPPQLESWNLMERLPTPAEQLDNLVLWIGERQRSFAESAILAAPAAAAWIGTRIVKGSAEAGLGWLLEQRATAALVEDRGMHQGFKHLRLNMDGWARYEMLTRVQVESRRVLMAMKFNTSTLQDAQLEELVDVFRPAVSLTGFDLFTLLEGPAGLIDDQLRVALRTSRFIIADLTYASRGAYWEAGFAEGLGRPVIYTCRQKEWLEEKVHFDTNHLRTIVWDRENLNDAATKLTAMIRATLPAEAKLIDP
jgi:hypothetical protein